MVDKSLASGLALAHDKIRPAIFQPNVMLGIMTATKERRFRIAVPLFVFAVSCSIAIPLITISKTLVNLQKEHVSQSAFGSALCPYLIGLLVGLIGLVGIWRIGRPTMLWLGWIGIILNSGAGAVTFFFWLATGSVIC